MREIGSPVAAAVVLRPPRAPERRSGRLANAGLMVTTFDKRSLPVRKQRISKARPNGKNSPLLDVLHRRHLTKALNHWPAPGSEDTELGVLMELEVRHGETEVYP